MLKVLLVFLMLAGIVFSAVNFFVPTNTADAIAVMGADVVDQNGNAYDCLPDGNQCMIVFPDPPKD